MKELLKSSNDTWSLNVGAGINNVGFSVGFTPDILMKSLELHAGVFNSWVDTLNFKFNPKIGLGITAKFNLSLNK